MANSTKQMTRKKVEKPSEDFPLFPHASGRWCKKIRGRHVYFGKIADDPKGRAALALYLEQADDLHAGRMPRPKDDDGLTLRDLCNRFMTAKRHKLDSFEIVERTWRDYHATCKILIDAFGKNRLVDDLNASDFAQLRVSLQKRLGIVALGNEINRCRGVFKFAIDEALTTRAVPFGQNFRKPSKKALRIARAKSQAKNGKRMLEASELRTVLEAANQPMRAFVWLAANCGLGNTDVAELPLSIAKDAVNSGWLNYPRVKTGTERRASLWPETREALREALARRPEPKDAADADLAFVTKRGQRWVRNDFDAVGQEFSKLLHKLGLKRRGLSFYCLRHTFRTVADASRDQSATDLIMGHTDNTMADAYREGIDDSRLVAVTDHVHKWLVKE